MIEWNSAAPKHEFDVKVGHLQVRVQGINPQDAIKNARHALSREMPRLWDVIHGLADARFQVTCCDSN